MNTNKTYRPKRIKPGQIHRLPRGLTGCYALCYRHRCLYVGKSTCIRTRLRRHLRKRIAVDLIVYFDLSRYTATATCTQASSLLQFVEQELIEGLNPVDNIKRPKFSLNVFHHCPMDFMRDRMSALPDVTKVRVAQ